MVIAFVLLTTVPGKEEMIAKSIKEKKMIKECHVVYGEYDLHVTVEVDDLHALDEFLHELRLVEGINHTMTLVALGA
jgi:DNA-binding Lrp family transcriptional regulator